MSSAADIRREMAARVSKARAASGRSVSEFSRIMRVSEPTYRRIVSGRTALKAENIQFMCDGMGVPAPLFFMPDFRAFVLKMMESQNDNTRATAR